MSRTSGPIASTSPLSMPSRPTSRKWQPPEHWSMWPGWRTGCDVPGQLARSASGPGTTWPRLVPADGRAYLPGPAPASWLDRGTAPPFPGRPSRPQREIRAGPGLQGGHPGLGAAQVHQSGGVGQRRLVCLDGPKDLFVLGDGVVGVTVRQAPPESGHLWSAWLCRSGRTTKCGCRLLRRLCGESRRPTLWPFRGRPPPLGSTRGTYATLG